MGGFESSAQAVGLFVAAFVVSVGLIFLINTGHPSQQEKLPQQMDVKHSFARIPDPVNNNLPSFVLTKLFGDSLFPEPRVNYRMKRSSDYLYNHYHRGNMESSAEPGGGGKHTEFHKIRHAMKRLGGGGLDSDAVLRIMLDSKPIPPEPPSTGGHRSPYHHREYPEAEHMALQQHRSDSTERFQELRQRKYDEKPSFLAPVSAYPKTSTTTTMIPVPAIIPEKISVPPVAKIIDSERSSNQSETVAAGDTETPRRAPNFQNSSTFVLEKLGFCYKRDDVLLVILITSSLNFTFVLLIWASVKWLSSSSCGGTDKEKHFHPLDFEEFSQPEASEFFWSPNVPDTSRNLTSLRKSRASTSLHNFRSGDYVTQQFPKRSQWSSMEDLRYAQA